MWGAMSNSGYNTLSIGGDADACVSFNGSWTGKILLESIEHDYTLHMRPEEFQVRIWNASYNCPVVSILHNAWNRIWKQNQNQHTKQSEQINWINDFTWNGRNINIL